MFNKQDFKLVTIIALFAGFLLSASFARAMDLEEASAYANFIKDVIDTTTIEKKGKFCIFGNDDVAMALVNQNPAIIKIDDLSKKHGGCNVVYVSQGMERGLRIELDRLAEEKILTIAIFEGFTNMGGMIQIQLGRRNFELTVSPKLLRAAGVKLDVLATNLIIN